MSIFSNHLPALVMTLMLYLLIGLAYFGWGHVIVVWTKNEALNHHPKITHIWLGWASTLLIFQIIHLFFPLNVFVVVPILMVGIFVSLRKIEGSIKLFLLKKISKLKMAGALIIGITLASWLASRSMLSPHGYDSGLYYLNTIRWFNSYPIIPGLGNLHFRLAFNQSFFTYVAALNFYPFFNNGRIIANSFLYLLSIVTIISYFRPVFTQPHNLINSHPLMYFPSIFILPFLVYVGLTTGGFATPSPDLSSMILQLILFVIYSRCIAEWSNFQQIHNYTAFLIAILAATTLTIKLSNLMFSGVILIVLLILLWKTSQKRKTELFKIFLPSVIVIVVWCLRGYVLSGAPLYPSLLGYIPIEWAIPKQGFVNEANWIYSWARMPGVHWSEVLGNWNWFQPWINQHAVTLKHFISQLIFSALGLIVSLIIRSLRKVPIKSTELLLIIPMVCSLLFWFFTAPDIRFANALLFLLPLSMILVSLASIWTLIRQKGFVILLIFAFILGNYYYFKFYIDNISTFKNISNSGFQTAQTVPLDIKQTTSGLTIYVPVTGDQCWDSPLPCTPYFNPSLELRNVDNLRSGFMVNEVEK